MASKIKSIKTTKKVIRRTSKSPRRNYSPTRGQPKIQFESDEAAYSDPVDSSRALLEHVVFERRDLESLSSQATELFNSQTTFQDEAERSWLLENIKSTKIMIKVDDVVHSVNANYAVKDLQPTVLLLHGFDEGGTWANWIKLAYPLSQRGRYSVIFVDLPGFGRSSGRNLDQASWKRHGPEIIVAILSSFHIQQSVNVVAECGGAATIVRTISRYPQWFRGRGLVFCNSMIGDFSESKAGDFDANLSRFNIYIIVYWIPDKDHTQYCVAYKRWNKLRQTGYRNLQLIDLDPTKQTMKLYYPAVHVTNISRCSSKNKAYVYKLHDDYIQQILDHLDRK